MREKQPGVWEVRVFTGNDVRGRPTQISRTVRGSKRDAQRLAAQLEVGPGSIGGADRNYYRLDGSDDADVGPDDNVVGGDTEPPTITITSPAAGEAYLQYDSIMIDYTCEDDADVVECAGDLPVGSLLDTSVPGDHAFTITASDEFGNTSSSTVSYRVVYQFSGFQEPVGDGLSAAQAGRTIPLTWTLTSATGPVTSPDAVSTVTAASVACDGEAGGELTPTDGVGTGLEYLADGTSVGTLFEFR